MADHHRMITLGPGPTPEQQQDAVRCVARNARDRGDLRHLLESLDLVPAAARLVGEGGGVR